MERKGFINTDSLFLKPSVKFKKSKVATLRSRKRSYKVDVFVVLMVVFVFGATISQLLVGEVEPADVARQYSQTLSVPIMSK